MRITLISILCLLLAAACGNSSEKGEKPVARVGKYYLDETELRTLMPKGIKGIDSVNLAKSYVDRWVKDHLQVKLAEDENLNSVAIDKLVEDYRNSLLMAAYQTKYLADKLDTIVSDKEIDEYYKANPENFQLKSNIVRVRYVKLGKKAPTIEKVKNLTRSDRPADLKQLEKYCVDNAENYYLDDASWLLFDDLLKEIPLKGYAPAELATPRFIELEDSAFVYFVNIKAFQTKETASPVSYVKEPIKNIILNKRKTKLLQQMEEELYKASVGDGSVEFYTGEKK